MNKEIIHAADRNLIISCAKLQIQHIIVRQFLVDQMYCFWNKWCSALVGRALEEA